VGLGIYGWEGGGGALKFYASLFWTPPLLRLSSIRSTMDPTVAHHAGLGHDVQVGSNPLRHAEPPQHPGPSGALHLARCNLRAVIHVDGVQLQGACRASICVCVGEGGGGQRGCF